MDLPNFPSVPPEMWGKSFWELLDVVVATFPKENVPMEHRNAAYDLFQSLRYLLPCPVCREHYQKFLQKHPLDTALYNRKTLVDFYFLMKKDVTSRTGRPFPIRTPDELLVSIARRLRLYNPTTAHMPQQSRPQAARARPLRTVRVAAASTIQRPAGCGCGK